MQYLKEAVTIFSPYCHHFDTIFRCHHFPVMNSRKDHEKLCVHIRNMHRYLHRVRKEIDNELAKTYRKKRTMKKLLLKDNNAYPLSVNSGQKIQTIFQSKS